jgi:hypothetical protein
MRKSKKTIWFCIVQKQVCVGRIVLHKTTNRMEAEEFADVLNCREENPDINYKIERELQ